MISCKEAVRLKSISMDGELPLLRRIALRMHLALCDYCRRYSRQLDYLSRLARGLKKNR